MAGRDRRRRRTALLVSLLIHTALLTPLLLVAPPLRMAQTPNRANMVLGLVPEANLGIATRQARLDRAAASQPVRAPTSPEQGPLRPLKPPPSVTALPASGRHAAAGAMAALPSTNSGAPADAAAGGNQDAVRRALSAALACAPSNTQDLDAEGRAACGKRLRDAAAAMGDAKVDTIPREKRAYYDAVQKAYQDIRHYQTPDTALTHLPGAEGMYDQRQAAIYGHPPVAGCGLKFGGPPGAKPAGAPPHSLFFKLGPVICGVAPPQGVLTEESATPNADDPPK